MTREHRTFGSFARRIKDIAGRIPDITNKSTSEMAIFAIAEVAGSTPVDVGTARSNWRLGLNREPGGTRAAFSPFPSRHRRPYGPGGTIGETRNRAGVVWASESAVRAKQPDDTVYIVNNLPYIRRLNEGWSSQAPAGFVQSGLQRARRRGIEYAKKLFREELTK